MQLHRALPEIRAKGAELVIVGNGNRHFATAFRKEMGLESPVYEDTQRAAYRALGRKRSIASVLSPAGIGRIVKTMRSGHRQKGVQGDAWQMGGVLVVRPGGEVAYQYLSEAPGDHPKTEAILRAL